MLLWMTGWARTTRIEDEKEKTLWELRILSGETKKQKENTNLKTKHYEQRKQTNLEQGIASNHYGAYRYSNHLRCDLMHGHVRKPSLILRIPII